jgi:hypothetical protein
MTAFKCGHCGEDLQKWHNLQNHLKLRHRNEKVPYPCGVCPRKYFLRVSFVAHLKSHNKEIFAPPSLEFPPMPSTNVDALLGVPPFVPSLPIAETSIFEASIFDTLITETATTSVIASATANGGMDIDRLKSIQQAEPLEIISNSLLRFSVDVLQYPNIPRNFLPKIAQTIQENILNPLRELVQVRNREGSDSKSAFDEFNDCFKNVTTERKVHKKLSEKQLFIKPIKHAFRKRQSYVHRRGIVRLREVSFSFTHIPLRKTLTALFAIPNVFDQVENFVHKLQSGNGTTICSFIQSEFWKEKLATTPHSDILLPYFLYVDGFGPDNSIGPRPKSHAMEAMSAKLPFIPHKVASKLCNIFLVLLYKSIDKKHGLDHFLTPVVNEAIDLEKNGIVLEINGLERKIQFVFCLMLGDNLGMNEILGYICSFVGNHPCRICKVPKELLVKQIVEDKTLLRNAQNYSMDLRLDSPSTTGIKQKCPLSRIPSFSVSDNISLDIMHDLLEGVAHYNLKEIINDFVNEKKYLTLETLNERVQIFDYGQQIGNVTVEIKKEHLDGTKFHMTASEMLCFVVFLPLMIGDLIPNSDRVWNFFLIFSQIVEIVTSYSITENVTIQLDNLVSKHHKEYIDLFGKTLKFKYHNMVHYGRVLRSTGPLMEQWCMRLEGSHRPKKIYCKANNCRKNLPYSIAMKDQWQFSQRILKGEDFSDNIVLGPALDGLHEYRHISFNGTKYERGQIIHFGYNDVDEKIPKIGQIVSCFHNVGKIQLSVLLTKTCAPFDEHFRCFFLSTAGNDGDLPGIAKTMMLDITKILSYPQNPARLRNGKQAIVLKPLPPHF